jgi:hypothetical protein
MGMPRPATRQLAIPIPHEAIAEFCRKWGIRRLSFFGSVTAMTLRELSPNVLRYVHEDLTDEYEGR